MKRLIFLFITVLLTSGSFGQQVTNELRCSLTEQFGAQVGTLIERQIVDVGSVKRIEVKVLIIKDLIAGTAKTALQFEYDYASSYLQETKVANLDADELDGIIKSLKELLTNVFPANRKTYTEIAYRSRTGFEIHTDYSPDQTKWATYCQLVKGDSNSRVLLAPEDLGILLSLIEKARGEMNMQP